MAWPVVAICGRNYANKLVLYGLAVHKSGSGLARAFLLEMWAALTCSKYGLASNDTNQDCARLHQYEPSAPSFCVHAICRGFVSCIPPLNLRPLRRDCSCGGAFGEW
jgi:hypothetical protein